MKTPQKKGEFTFRYSTDLSDRDIAAIGQKFKAAVEAEVPTIIVPVGKAFKLNKMVKIRL